MNHTRCYLLACAALSGCSTPDASTSAYPQNAAISSPVGVPHDSAISYFPASASVNTSPDSLMRQLGGCESEFQDASKELGTFNAPVLYNYYPGHAIYRFLWSRSFDRPVLLTLALSEAGGILRTQLLSKNLMFKTLSLAEEQQTLKRIAEAESLAREEKDEERRASFLGSAKSTREDLRLTKLPLEIITGKPVTLSNAQVQQFRELLMQAGFWQLPSCEPIHLTDGSSWVLEAHEPDQYKVVFRQSPRNEQAPFRRCCEFLLNLSEARSEERY
ncbi:hypothetical protein [Hymenobacter negativus]|uniref:Lipoprotein n=1 Tax=Hymenobacter negativus TaxID=2795026 RepID=A0ABS3QHR3_9BACT|nr:hypothetical protein [Hymenobacter negativus]MBO2010774.1 hypothetical protein [Hymenobacter negativus]